MRIGTTPTHTFELPPDIAKVATKVRVVYSQNGAKVLTRETEEIEGNSVVFKLTQEETLKFSYSTKISIQLRVLTISGDSLTSSIIVTSPYPCLENEVFE